MSFSFSSLIRLLVFLALGTTMLAVGLSRLDPPGPESRSRQGSRYTNVNDFILDVADRVPRWLDSETGRIEAHAPADGDIFESASCAPWVDSRGRRQAAGRWASRTREGPSSMSRDFGLARYLFPSGEVLDHVSTEIVPVSPPCWYPGTRARVLFAAGDGMLYQYAFEPDPARDRPGHGVQGDPRPRPLTWRCPLPGSGQIFIGDATWPDDPRMAGRLVVSLREQEPSPQGVPVFTRTKLWWLGLNAEGTEVVEAGPILERDREDSSSRDSDLRCPTVWALPDGRLALAYLCQGLGGRGWTLRVAPVEFEGDHQVPRARESRSRALATDCPPAQPVFSADGRWLNAIIGLDIKQGRATRIPTGSFAML